MSLKKQVGHGDEKDEKIEFVKLVEPLLNTMRSDN